MADPIENPVSFVNEAETLRGTLHVPADDAGTAVVFLHGWSGSSIGPHRMFVHAARRLSAMGCTCLRFDFRGRGDSDGHTAGATIRSMIQDTACATTFVQRERSPQTILYLGICSGGKIAVGAAADTPAVDGLVLWSAEAIGPLRSEASSRRKTHRALGDYIRKLGRAGTWKKILTGNVNRRLVKKALVDHEMPAADELKRETMLLDRFRSFEGSIQFIYGTHDPDTRSAAENYASFCERAGIPADFHAIEGANHSFYSLEWEQQVMSLSEDWITRRFLDRRDD